MTLHWKRFFFVFQLNLHTRLDSTATTVGLTRRLCDGCLIERVGRLGEDAAVQRGAGHGAGFERGCTGTAVRPLEILAKKRSNLPLSWLQGGPHFVRFCDGWPGAYHASISCEN